MKVLKAFQGKAYQVLGKDFYHFLSHSKNYVTASLFASGLGIISVPIFTRLLVPADYGILAILSSFISIFSIIYGLGVRSSVVRYYFEDNDDFNKYLGSTLSLLFIWIAVLTLILIFCKNLLFRFFQVPLGIIYIGIATVIFQAMFTLYQSYLQAIKKSKKIAFLTVIQKIAGILIGVILILQMQQDKFYGRAFATLAVTVLLGFYSIYHLTKIARFSINWTYIKYTLIFSLPVVFHLLSQYILSSFDNVIINQLTGPSETGLYSMAYSIGAIQSLISMGMLRAWTPEFYGRLKERSYGSINPLASKFARLVYISGFTLILFSRELVMVLADKKYHGAIDIVPIIIVSYIFYYFYTMYVNFAFYHKKTYLIAIITVIAGAIKIGLNYWLIPIYGYKIAAWTTMIAYASLFILHYLNVRFIIKPEWITSLKVLLPNFMILIIFIVIYYFLSSMVSNTLAILLIKITLLLLLSFILFGKELIKKIKKHV